MKQKIVLVISIAIGLLAAMLTRTYLASKDAEIQQLKADFLKKHKTIDVLCFAREVPSGTVLAKSDLGIKTVPASGLRGQALTEENAIEVIGRKILNGHKTGELVFWADIEGGNPIAGGLAADKPNDHVDVIASYATPKVAEDGHTMIQELSTRTILQNVLVLATGKETAKSAVTRSDAFGGGTYSMVTLEVSPREAELLVFYEQIKGRIYLALRNRNDTYYEKELPQIDIKKIGEEIEELNKKRQSELNGGF